MGVNVGRCVVGGVIASVLAGAGVGAVACSSSAPLPRLLSSLDSGGNGDSGGRDAPLPVGDAHDASVEADADPLACPPEPDAGLPNTLCNPSGQWATAVALALPTTGSDHLQSVTPDELSVAWSAQGGPASTFNVADRSVVTDAFGTPQALSVPGAEAVSLSPDGLRVAALSSTLASVVELTRPARGMTFGSPGDGTFATLNANAASTGTQFADIVISADDLTLYYSSYDGSGAVAYTVYVSTRSGTGPWPVGQPLQQCELKGAGTVSRRPTGISADGLTLFYFDEHSSSAKAAFRPAVNAPFVHFVDLGLRLQAQPNSACSQLYFSASEDASVEIFTSAAQ
jgi:hypothetical protein